MKLSEAIRLGATLRPQGFGAFNTDEGTCAIGAAFNAIGKDAEIEQVEEWNDLILHRFECPVCDRRAHSTIVHLNDFHRWTREQIASWVESIEARITTTEDRPEVVER